MLEIPKDLRPHFGRARFKQTLQTDSLTLAEKRVWPVVTEWKREIDRVRHGSPGSTIRDAHIEADKLRRQGLTDDEIAWVAFDALTTSEGPGTLRFESDEAEKWFDVAAQEIFPLTTYIDDWHASLTDAGKTKDMKRADIERFTRAFPDANQATEKSVMLWVEETLIAQDGLSAATCRRIISFCKGYWKWLARYKHLKVPSPFTSEVVPRKNASEAKRALGNRRLSFSVEDYHKLLSGVPEDDPALRDLIILGAHTGARIEELCSLKTNEVTEDRFKITDAKTERGVREIPIHTDVRELVANLKASSADGYLLSGLTYNKYGDRSNAIGKRFGRLKDRLGFGPSLVFHSLRKSVARQLEDAGVLENISARLLGHELKTMTYGLYSAGVKFDRLQEAIEKVSW